MAGQTAITVEDVFFSYEDLPVLEDVNFTIEKGQFLSMIGPNGGGKTTLLRLLLGLLKPDRGEIRIFEQPPKAVRQKIGYVPQYSLFDPQFPVTVMDVVLMGRVKNRFGMYSKEDRTAAGLSLGEVGLSALKKRALPALSGGQRQRVLIARALVGEPEILLLDEPTAHVDSSVGDKLNSLLQDLNKRMTIMLATHDMGFVSHLVGGVICVNRKVVMHPTSKIDGETINRVYAGDMRLVRHDIFCGEVPDDLPH